MSFNSLLNKNCFLLVKTQSQGATGEITDNFGRVQDGAEDAVFAYRCNQGRSASNDQTIGNISEVSARFYFLSSVEIGEGMQIEDAEGLKWEILNVTKDSSGHHWEVEAKRVIYD